MHYSARLYYVNIITLLRFGFAALFLWYARQDMWAVVLGLAIVAFSTDWIDGYLARKWEVVSAFGKFADPLADKVVTSSLLWLVAAYNDWSPLYVVPVLIISAYDVTMTAVRLRGNQQKDAPKVVTSNQAKIKTATQMVALGLLLGGIVLDQNGHSWLLDYLSLPALGAATAMTIKSGYVYYKALTSGRA